MKLDKYLDTDPKPLKKSGVKKPSKPKEKRVNVPLIEAELEGLEKLRAKIGDSENEITISNLVRIACRVAHASTSYKTEAKDVLQSFQRGKKNQLL